MEFPIGRVNVNANTAVKAFDVPEGDTKVKLNVTTTNGVHLGASSSVSAANGYFVNGGEVLELTLAVPAGETASIWVRGASTQQSTLAFIVGRAA